jgi:hypothetical protein
VPVSFSALKLQESVATLSDDGEVEVDSEKLNALRKIVMQAIEKRSAHAEEAQRESGARCPRLFPHFDRRIHHAQHECNTTSGFLSVSALRVEFRTQSAGIAFLLPVACTLSL